MAKTKSAVGSTSHSVAAGKVLDKIRALHGEIPGFQQPQSKVAARRLTANASFSDEFLEAIAVTVQGWPSLKSASGLDPNANRETIRFAAAYGAIADEAEAFARAVRYTINVRRAASARDSLAAYNLAKGLARKPEGASLNPHIAEIRKTIPRGGSRRKTPKPEPQS